MQAKSKMFSLTRKLINAHIAAEWRDYTTEDVTVSKITDPIQFTYGAQDAGAKFDKRILRQLGSLEPR